MAESQVKRRKLTDKALIKEHGAVLTADDVMRITGVASKATALKRMNCADEHAMLAKKGVRAGYEYSQENKKHIRTDSLVQFKTKYRYNKWIEKNRPFYDDMFRLVLKTV
jgi:hypothetical protein